MLRRWLHAIARRLQPSRHRRRRARPLPIVGCVERLEPRAMLANFVVSTLVDEAFDGGDLATETADGGGLSLREAIGLANQNLGAGAGSGDEDGDVITLGLGGVINLTRGQLTITDDVHIDGNGSNTTIDAGFNGRIFDVNVAADNGAAGTEVVRIEDLILQNAFLLGGGGGAIVNRTNAAAGGFDATLQVVNTILQNNTAYDGGAIYTLATNTTANVRTLEVLLGNLRQNTARNGGNTAGSGGALAIADGNVLVVNSIVTQNEAVRAGGGIEIVRGILDVTAVTQITSNDVSASGNFGSTAGNGGGLHVSQDAVVTFDGTNQILNNVAQAEGGGLWNSATGTMTLGADFVTTNVARGNASPGTNGGNVQGGGGIFNDGGTLTLTGAVLQQNAATGPTRGSGGGLLSIGGNVTVTVGQINANEAVRAGGGIEVVSGNLMLTGVNLINNDISNTDLLGRGLNSANPGNGGGLHVTGDAVVTITGGTVANNAAQAEGGGLWNSATGTLNVLSIGGNNLLVDNNRAHGNAASGLSGTAVQGGGGIFNDGGTLNLESTAGGTITVSNNRATGANNGSGGGILTVGGDVTITGVDITANEAVRAGGGIEVVAGSVTITGSNIGTNDVSAGNLIGGTILGASPGNGGGLHVTGAADVTIDGGSILNNDAGREGGGLWNSSTGTLTIQNGTVISGNTTEAAPDVHDGGGGIFNDGGTLIIDGTGGQVVVSSNKANNTATNDRASGGGILSIGGDVTITNAAITGNEAIRAGGGIEVVTGTVSLVNVALDGNDVSAANLLGGTTLGSSPGNGGGLHVTGRAHVGIEGGTVSNNDAGREGGGLWNSSTGTMTITNGTVIGGNSIEAAPDPHDGGGGIFNDGGTLVVDGTASRVTITNNVANNLATNDDASGGGILSIGGTVHVTDADIVGNEAIRAGGGIEIVTGSLSLVGSTLNDNDVSTGGSIATAAPGNGGGLHVTGAANVLIDGGQVSGNDAAAEGGGLWNSATGTLVLTDRSGTLAIQNNTAAGNAAPGVGDADVQGGGGIFNDGGTLRIRNESADTVIVQDNDANGANGRGGGLLSLGGTVTIDGAILQRNEAVAAGGGIAVVNGTIDIVETMILGNGPEGDLLDPVNGGGIHVGLGAAPVVNLRGSTVAGNNARNDGGGIWNSANGTVNLVETTIGGLNGADGNTTDSGSGGGIWNALGGTITLDRSTVANNTSGADGGGIFTSGSLTATNATISGNVAGDDGGGIAVTAPGVADLRGTTVADNTANSQGGGVDVGGTLRLANTIVADNTATGLGPDVRGAITSDDFNLIGDDTNAVFLGGTQTNDLVNQDPNLGPLADNGGPTVTHLPGAGPAVDSGSSAATVDQRGSLRPGDGQDDRGAVELADTRPTLVALRENGQLLTFDADDPTTILSTVTVTGLGTDETLIGIDANLLEGVLYGVSDRNRIYTIDPTTGVATLVDVLTQGVNDGALVALANTLNFFVDSEGLFEGSGVKWLRGNTNAFGQPWYFITPEGDLFEWNGSGQQGNRLLSLGRNAFENPQLVVDASNLAAANPGEVTGADQMRGFYRSSKGNFFRNAFGADEKWFKGEIAEKGAGNQGNPWYYVLPDGRVFEWSGSGLTGTQVVGITADPNLWRDPTLLTDAFVDPTVDSMHLDHEFHFQFAHTGGVVRNLFENSAGEDEKWFTGDVHAAGNNWYYIRPSGEVVAWDGVGAGGGEVVGWLGANAWNNLEQVVDDDDHLFHRVDSNQLVDLDFDLGLFRYSKDRFQGRNFFENFSGLGERHVRGVVNSLGTNFYFITPSGGFFESDGVNTHNQIAQLSPDVFDNPALLYDAYADGSARGGQRTREGDALNLGGFFNGVPGSVAGLDTVIVNRPDGPASVIQIVTGNDQNLRADFDTGRTTVGPNVNPAAPLLVGIAYDGLFTPDGDNPFALDTGQDDLDRFDPATGTSTTVGATGTTAFDLAGLEGIGAIGVDGVLFGAIRDAAGSDQHEFFTLNPTTGAAASLGVIGGGFTDIHDVARLLDVLG